MFDAIKAVNATPSIDYKTPRKEKEVIHVTPDPIAEAVVLASDKSPLKEQWMELGIPFGVITKKSTPSLLIVDGIHPPSDASSKQTIETCLQNGGTVLVWGVSPESCIRLNELLPSPLELTERKATSFIKKADDVLIGILDNKDFYFTELTRQPVMIYGLAGEIVKHGKVILEACTTDWGRWNSRPEYLKTAAVYRSERETKSEGRAIVKIPSGKGQLYLMSIDLQPLRSEGETLLRTLMENIGLSLKDIPYNTRRAFTAEGTLERAYYLTEKNVDESKIRSMANQPFAAAYETGKHLPLQTDIQGYATLSRLPDVTNDDKTVYISFWVFSPRSLINLLVEPDMPKLNLIVEGQTGVKTSINGVDRPMNGMRLDDMPLERGWNHLLLRFEREGTSQRWRAKIQLESDNPSFFQQVKSSVAMP
jgi:beta-galactosidase